MNLNRASIPNRGRRPGSARRLSLSGCIGSGSLCLLLFCCTPDAACPTRSEVPVAGQVETNPAPPPEPIPTRVEIGATANDGAEWLAIHKVRGEAAGAWATGSFDADRNKLTIETHDVAEFSINVSRIPIRWDKLVVIRIDGRNSELVQRDYSTYHFVLDEHKTWVISE